MCIEILLKLAIVQYQLSVDLRLVLTKCALGLYAANYAKFMAACLNLNLVTPAVQHRFWANVYAYLI